MTPNMAKLAAADSTVAGIDKRSHSISVFPNKWIWLLAWPYDLPPTVVARAREVGAMVGRGDSDVAIAKGLGLPVRRVHVLSLIADCIAFDETGQLGPELQELLDVLCFLPGAFERPVQ